MSVPQPSPAEAGPSEPSYEVVLRRGPSAPSVLAALGSGLSAGLEAVSARFADLYVLGARAVLDRKERLEDDLAERRAAARSAVRSADRGD